MDNLHFSLMDQSYYYLPFVAKKNELIGRKCPNPHPSTHRFQFDFSIFLFTQGEYYNQDEIQTMVTAEVLEEERKKKEDNAQLEASMAEAEVVEQAELEKSKKKRRKGPMVAA